jgi:chorismate mutase
VSIEEHRSLTEDLDRALVELLTKRVLDGDQLAER